MSESRAHYYPHIDGLRAIAVVGVLLFHAELGFPGGYVGVDVFFVISGYLLTGLMLRDAAAGRFSTWHFWERRTRRIFPALAVVLIASFGAAWLLLGVLCEVAAQASETVRRSYRRPSHNTASFCVAPRRWS